MTQADTKTFDSYIIKGVGGFYYVKTADGVVECKPRGIFRKRKITPVAGDFVRLEQEGGSFVIAEILPRKNLFIRPPVANLDYLFIVASTVQPVPSTRVIDKLTAIAVNKGVRPVLVLTKTDLHPDGGLGDIYRHAGIPVIAVDHATGAGLEEVKSYLPGHICAVCGNSGVGKSTLLNALLPQLERQTGDISQKLGRGRHTTREVELLEAFGGLLADTPGFASLDTSRALHIPKEELQHAFPEFEPYFGQCKFTGCAHISEKGCAVLQALQEGEIEPSRYESYAALYQEAKDVKEWEL